MSLTIQEREERRRRTAMQPDCARCRNKAPMNSPYCAACEPVVAAEREASDLTDEFRAIERDAEASASTADSSDDAFAFHLIARLARAIAQARETE